MTIIVFVLGLLSLFGIGFSLLLILGPVAWVLGSKARREIASNPGEYRASPLLRAGWIMGIISTVVLALVIVFLIILLIAFLDAGAALL